MELGAGPGLAGLLLAHLGANVVLTDKAPVLPIIQSNVQLNGLGGKGTVPAGKGTADVAELEWGPGECCGRTVAALAADGVDWVIAADCCYVDNELAESPSTAHFVAACAGLCGPATKCLVSFELRSQAVKVYLHALCRRPRPWRLLTLPAAPKHALVLVLQSPPDRPLTAADADAAATIAAVAPPTATAASGRFPPRGSAELQPRRPGAAVPTAQGLPGPTHRAVRDVATAAPGSRPTGCLGLRQEL